MLAERTVLRSIGDMAVTMMSVVWSVAGRETNLPKKKIALRQTSNGHHEIARAF